MAQQATVHVIISALVRDGEFVVERQDQTSTGQKYLIDAATAKDLTAAQAIAADMMEAALEGRARAQELERQRLER